MGKTSDAVPSNAQIDEARRRGEERAAKQNAKRMVYDRAGKALEITMRSGLFVRVPIAKIPWLEGATPAQLGTLKLYPTGEAIELRELDLDFSVVGMLREILGLEVQQHRAARVKSEKRSAASRANGAKGGRPRKTPAAG